MLSVNEIKEQRNHNHFMTAVKMLCSLKFVNSNIFKHCRSRQQKDNQEKEFLLEFLLKIYLFSQSAEVWQLVPEYISESSFPLIAAWERATNHTPTLQVAGHKRMKSHSTATISFPSAAFYHTSRSFVLCRFEPPLSLPS